MRSEKLPQKIAPATEKMDEDMRIAESEMPNLNFNTPVISRRDFLAGLIALGTHGAIRHAESAAGDKKERADEKTQTYEEGLSALREKSLLSSYEHIAVYARNKDGTKKWTHRESASESSVNLDTPDEIAALLQGEAQEISIIHTHPLALVYRDPEILKRAREGNVPLLAMPPSFMDVSGAMHTIAPLSPEMSRRIEWRVVDPVGIWEYRIDRDHNYFKKITRALREIADIATELDKQDDMRRFVEKYGLADADPRVISDMLDQRQKELSRFSQALVKKLIDKDRILSNDPAIQKILRTESEHPSFPPNSPGFNALIDAYRAIGTTLHFIPHKSH